MGKFDFGLDTAFEFVVFLIVFKGFIIVLFDHVELSNFIIGLYFSKVGELDINSNGIFEIVELFVGFTEFLQIGYF